MDDSRSLEAVANTLNEIAEKPFDIALHLRHIELTKNLDADSHMSALQMMTDLVAAGDEVWIPLIESKEKSVDLQTEQGVEDLLQLYERAERDYQSFPILQRHLKFLLDHHARYSTGEEPKPNTLGETFSSSWTLARLQSVVTKGISHLSKSHLLFDAQRDWLLEQLETASQEEKPVLIEFLEDILNIRLKQAHSNSDETFQAYSTFTTRYKSPSQYEELMVTASRARGSSVKTYERRDALESALAQTHNSLDAFAKYIAYERRGKVLDLLATRGIYERAITEAANRRHKGEQAAEQALDAFWAGYLDAMRILEVGVDVEHELYVRALRSVPASGEVWARYIRFLERASKAMDAPQDLESISDAYNRAISSGLHDTDMEKIIAITLAYAGWEKRRIGAGEGSEDSLPNLIAATEGALEAVHKVNKAGDPKFRLEKFLAGVYHDAELFQDAIGVWQTASKKYKQSYAVWLNYTEALIKYQAFDEARAVFFDVHLKRMDWPEAIWEAWLSFEHLHGTIEDLNTCLDKVEKASNQLNAYRARELEKAYRAQGDQYSVTVPAEPTKNTTAPTAEAMNVDTPPVVPDTSSMDVDAPVASESKKRRTNDEEPLSEGNKRAKMEPNPATLKRDRENTTVFVADLPPRVTEDELKALFKDCGGVREVKITKLPSAVVALVEFYERESVPPALTKDKKRVQDQEIAVHLAWKSTLYVTNFPESADDAYIRNLFGKYGTLFDVRWPSKKFKTTRRFCYVQFTSPDAAQQALELHGKELEPDLALNVYISNPERKKERTDADANEREVYVAGLSRYTNEAEMTKLFSTYGKIKELRMPVNQDGHSVGYAFVEYEDPQDARRALAANNHEIKKRRIAATLADPRVRARHNKSETGLGRSAEMRSRSVRVRNLPPNTQDGLLQQVFEKIAAVRRVEVFVDKNEAVVELETAADAGKLLLRTEPVIFQDRTLQISEEGKEGAPGRSAAPPPKTGGSLFVPRRAGAVSRPRAGLGHSRATAAPVQPAAQSSAGTSGAAGSNKGQDDFRKMLMGGK